MVDNLGSHVRLIVMNESFTDEVIAEENATSNHHMSRGRELKHPVHSSSPCLFTDGCEELRRGEAINGGNKEPDLAEEKARKGSEHELFEPLSWVMMALIDQSVQVLHVEPWL